MEKPDGAARRDLVDAKTLRRLCVASNWAGAVQTASHVGAVGATGASCGSRGGPGGRSRYSWFTACFSIFCMRDSTSSVMARYFALAGSTSGSVGYLDSCSFIRAPSIRCSTWPIIVTPRTGRATANSRAIPYTLKSYLLWMSGVSYWYTRWRRIVRFSVGVVTEPYLPEYRHAELIREARIHLAGYALIAGLIATRAELGGRAACGSRRCAP